MLIGIDHVQLAMPEGGEDAARAFFADVLRMREVAKPDALAGRGGVWFAAGPVALHMGVEADFTPAKKAHPAFRVTSLARICAVLDAAGVDWKPDADLPGIRRVFVADPFGNRIELLERDG